MEKHILLRACMNLKSVSYYISVRFAIILFLVWTFSAACEPVAIWIGLLVLKTDNDSNDLVT